MSESVATLEQPSQLFAELDRGEWLHQRTEQALEDCDFVRTPELEQSIGSFYTDHYQLASLMELGLQEGGAQGMPEEDQRTYLKGIIEGSYFDHTQIEDAFNARLRGYGTYHPYVQQVAPLLARVRLARLDDPEDPELRKVELSALSEAGGALFAEASVGATTLTSTEADLVFSLRKATHDQMKESGLFPHLEDSRYDRADPFYEINNAIETFRRDSRFAGQLLFHNTGHFQDLSSRGEVLPRRMQKERYGTVNTQTAEELDGHIHAPTPHWSEGFDPNNYRGSRARNNGGTIAVPLAEIVQAAPFGRDAHYGVLTLKPEAVEYMAESIHRNDGVSKIGFGSADYQGGAGIDRTFYSSPHDVPADAPIEEAPDGYTIPIGEEAYWVQLQDEDAGKVWGASVQPEPYIIPTQPFPEAALNKEGGVEVVKAWREQRNRTIARSVRELQDRSIRRYPGAVVVPLRAGVMEFYVPDDGAQDTGKRRAQFTRIEAES